MIGFSFKAPPSLAGFIGALKGPGRVNLFSAAAAAVCALTRSHIARESGLRHRSAARLGATPTGHLEKAARKTVFHADQSHGEVVIPAPGFGRAFHDVEITPVNATRLTIPINALSYGRRAGEMRSLGWKFFTPSKGHDKEDILFGYRGKGKDREVVPLYLMKKSVQQRQDRGLLPSDAAIRTTAARAMMSEINRVARKAKAR